MTTTTSDDFYVTLPSNASTDEFQANAPNHFTVRLPRPLHLPGEGWKVGLSSLSLPDTRADLYRLVPKQQYLFSLKWFVLRNGKRTRRRTTVQMDDIDHLDSVVDGEHFMRAIIQHLEGQRRRGRHGDLFINDQALHRYVKWDWVRHGSEVELKINNTDMVRAGRLKTTKVSIDVALALKMGGGRISRRQYLGQRLDRLSQLGHLGATESVCLYDLCQNLDRIANLGAQRGRRGPGGFFGQDANLGRHGDGFCATLDRHLSEGL